MESGKGAVVPAGPTGLSVLIVEDNADAGETLGELLGLYGHEVRVERCGEGGVAAVATRMPDVLLCDLGLPDVPGLEVIRRVRGLAGGRGVFAVALTGHAHPRDRAEALGAGFDAHLAKPPSLDDLARAMAAAGERRRASAV